MARLARSTFPAYGVWHATTRGVARQRVFRDADDARVLLAELADAVRELELHALALCLMPNHYHFVVECARDVLSKAMHRANGIYAAAFNAKYKRSGHLWGEATASRSGR